MFQSSSTKDTSSHTGKDLVRAHQFSYSKNLIIMSVKGRIASFYNNKSQVVNSLWILAQVCLIRESDLLDRFCSFACGPSGCSLCVPSYNFDGCCHEGVYCFCHSTLSLHVHLQADEGQSGRVVESCSLADSNQRTLYRFLRRFVFDDVFELRRHFCIIRLPVQSH